MAFVGGEFERIPRFHHWITHGLAVGRFATMERAPELQREGITAILNVSDQRSLIPPGVSGGFHEIAWIPLTDHQTLSLDRALACLETLHEMLARPGSKVYVHCIAGQLRSPTVIWLYLVARGIPEDDARALIEQRAAGTCPGHPRIVSLDLVRQVRDLGPKRLAPLDRPEVLKPF